MSSCNAMTLGYVDCELKSDLDFHKAGSVDAKKCTDDCSMAV